MKRLYFTVTFCIAALLLLLASACNSSQTPTPAPATSTPQASPTPAATNTPTPLPGKAFLVAGEGTDATLLTQAQSLLVEQAAQAGYAVETRATLQLGDLSPEVKLVVALAQPPNLADLLAAAPQAQFVVITAEALEPAANLTVIRQRSDHQAFIAGYIATLISDDWRAGGLISTDAPQMQDAFANGGRYFCGVCSPGWPLGATFPLAAGAAAPADGPAWAAVAADLFDNGKVESFYLSPQAVTPEVIAYLAGRMQFENEVKVVGALPPPPELSAQWAATVGFDPLEALREALPEALSGKSAGSLSVPVSLSDVNPQVFSPGRMELVKGLMAELAAGRLEPLSVP